MPVSPENGRLMLLREKKIEGSIDLLQQDPITLRSFLSLAVECLRKKKDLVLAAVTKKEKAARETDPIQPSMYLGESITMHRFSVCYSNPNVISVTKRDVLDPMTHAHIEDIYYYSVPHMQLNASLSKDLLQSLVGQKDESSPFSGLSLLLTAPLVAEFIGTENDFATNSVFYYYIQHNKILEDIPNVKQANEERISEERRILTYCLSVSMLFLSASLVTYAYKGVLNILVFLGHILLFSFALLILVLNRR